MSFNRNHPSEHNNESVVNEPKLSGFDNFDTPSLLATGSSSKIWLSKIKSTRQDVALKVLSKDDSHTKATPNADISATLKQIRQHPFILTLQATFETETSIVEVTPYLPHGDLEIYMQKHGKLNFATAQFFAAELYCALDYMHQNGFIHRNLKLDHLLLTSNGHVNLTGFFVCKGGMGPRSRTSSFCGSAVSAPEILLDRPYDRAVDWWGLGILLYEMLQCRSPFSGEDEDEIYDQILSESQPEFSPDMQESSVSAVQGFLQRDPEKRLGCGETGQRDIMNHAFFAEVDWTALSNQQIPSPFLHAMDPLES